MLLSVSVNNKLFIMTPTPTVINLLSEMYPELLCKVPKPPNCLYCKGNLDRKIFSNCLAVVGSRRMSAYGKKVIEHLFSTLSKDITIVSGFMSGVDAEAHFQAMRFGLKTIAVMPCGIDYIHPENQSDLYYKIISSEGLILSEYEGDFRPKVWTYPRRNRIVAGLSKAVLVIEASANSGSLITANFAKSYGRNVFVVPGSIFSDLSKGKMQIGNEFAKSIDSGLYINKFMGLKSLSNITPKSSSFGENPVLEALRSDPMTIDELSAFLLKDVPSLSTELTLLSLDGLIFEEGGKFYAC